MLLLNFKAQGNRFRSDGRRCGGRGALLTEQFLLELSWRVVVGGDKTDKEQNGGSGRKAICMTAAGDE
jgi:hypothetical protein